jgi:hypothetical protein
MKRQIIVTGDFENNKEHIEALNAIIEKHGAEHVQFINNDKKEFRVLQAFIPDISTMVTPIIQKSGKEKRRERRKNLNKNK